MQKKSGGGKWEIVQNDITLPTHFWDTMMINLIGEFVCKIDGKGRIVFPAGLKRQLPGEGDLRFVINRGFEANLVIYTAAEWKKISEEVNQLNTYVKKNRDFLRYFYRGATEITLDNSSRLLVPKSLLKYAGIEKDVIMFAYANKIEVWDKTRYENLLTDEPEDFSALAEDVMSKKDKRGTEDVS
jgi:MraZ protein